MYNLVQHVNTGFSSICPKSKLWVPFWQHLSAPGHKSPNRSMSLTEWDWCAEMSAHWSVWPIITETMCLNIGIIHCKVVIPLICYDNHILIMPEYQYRPILSIIVIMKLKVWPNAGQLQSSLYMMVYMIHGLSWPFDVSADCQNSIL